MRINVSFLPSPACVVCVGASAALHLLRRASSASPFSLQRAMHSGGGADAHLGRQARCMASTSRRPKRQPSLANSRHICSPALPECTFALPDDLDHFWFGVFQTHILSLYMLDFRVGLLTLSPVARLPHPISEWGFCAWGCTYSVKSAIKARAKCTFFVIFAF
jgi:hypothetical protein